MPDYVALEDFASGSLRPAALPHGSVKLRVVPGLRVPRSGVLPPLLSDVLVNVPSLVLNNERFVTVGRDQFRQVHEPTAGIIASTHVSIVSYPDGDMEISGCHRPQRGGQGRVSTEEEKEKIEAARARREIRRMVKYYGLDHMWTGNYRGKHSDRGLVLKDLYKFERLVRKIYPQFRLVLVLEIHHGGGENDGGYHFHFAVHGFYDVKVLRDAWWKVVGIAQGNVDVQSRCAVTQRSVTSYLIKYIVKEFEDQDEDGNRTRKKG
ncbi:MAG: hypothetical protein Q8O71_04270, partial [bacterium]|nr:hypothetical protein [bacterium]